MTEHEQAVQRQPMKLKASGWLARIFLHEVDHLNGVLFVDLAEKVWPFEAKRLKSLQLTETSLPKP